MAVVNEFERVLKNTSIIQSTNHYIEKCRNSVTDSTNSCSNNSFNYNNAVFFSINP